MSEKVKLDVVDFQSLSRCEASILVKDICEKANKSISTAIESNYRLGVSGCVDAINELLAELDFNFRVESKVEIDQEGAKFLSQLITPPQQNTENKS